MPVHEIFFFQQGLRYIPEYTYNIIPFSCLCLNVSMFGSCVMSGGVCEGEKSLRYGRGTGRHPSVGGSRGSDAVLIRSHSAMFE